MDLKNMFWTSTAFLKSEGVCNIRQANGNTDL